jgi:hypothetical protein
MVAGGANGEAICDAIRRRAMSTLSDEGTPNSIFNHQDTTDVRRGIIVFVCFAVSLSIQVERDRAKKRRGGGRGVWRSEMSRG